MKTGLNINSHHEKLDNRFMFYLLSNTPTIGAISIMKLYNQFPELKELLELDSKELASMEILHKGQVNELVQNRDNIDTIYEEFRYMEQSDISFITYEDEDYPNKLRNISSAPMVLYVKGELPDTETPSVAIVGARASTNYGISSAEFFSEYLANEGINIISGMARGIDGAAHRGALKSRNGKTYSILGCGVNIIYPRENMDIYEAVYAGGRGGILSEVPPGTSAVSQNFPIRNRIISGLADVVLIVEAREKSGSLITADLALDQGKDVMAIPGRITDPMSKGCNALISAGARIANSPSDVLDVLNICVRGEMNFPEKNIKLLANKEKIVYSTLDSAPKHTEEIVYLTGLPMQEVVSILIELELKGFAVQISSNYYGAV